jgi:uncharacterized pyridoxamine 5'-phosphate oxidase family protein
MSLNKKEIKQLLTTEEIAFISTTKANRSPHIAPIWFVYHDNEIWFETDITTVKFKNIEKLNKVAICFGGKNTYIIEGSLEWFKEGELNFPIRKLYWNKYGKEMDDNYITEKTRLFKVKIEKEMSWHYAPEWD